MRFLSNEQNDKKEVLGITELSQSLLVPDIDGIQTLSKLAIFARKMIIDEIKQSREIVAKIAKNIPTEDLYRGRKLRLVTPGPEDTKNQENIKLLRSSRSRRPRYAL